MIFLIEILAGIIAIAIAITVHEFGHAWVADRLGDPTPRIQGRLSLNPIKHYDKVGSTIFLITYFLSIFNLVPFPFGWAKPVESDPLNLRNPRKDMSLISFSGSFFNILLSVLLSLILRFSLSPFTPFHFLYQFVVILIRINIYLAVFNLIPVHPLDGGKVILGLLSDKQAEELDLFLHRYGTMLFIFLLFPIFNGVSLISLIISPVVSTLFNLLIP